MDLFVSHRELEQLSGTSHSTYAFWTLEVVKNRLERFVGVLKRGAVISYVEMKLKQDGNECCSVEIPTSLPPDDRRMYNSYVSFYIGFTWSGPKAFNLGEPQWVEVLGDADDKIDEKQSYCMNVDEFPTLGTTSNLLHVEGANTTKLQQDVCAEVGSSNHSLPVTELDNERWPQCSSVALLENDKENNSENLLTQGSKDNTNCEDVMEEPRVLSQGSTSKSSEKKAKKQKKKNEGWETVQRHSKKK